MSEEQARQRAQELTKKALAEAENETFNLGTVAVAKTGFNTVSWRP